MAGMRVEVGLQEKWTNLAPFLYRLNNYLLKMAIPALKIVISYGRNAVCYCKWRLVTKTQGGHKVSYLNSLR